MTTAGGTTTCAYGSGSEQVADLVLPPGEPPASGWAVVVLVHGGFWRDQYHRDLMVPLSDDLAGRGLAIWNVEYRRVGPTGGGVPQTLADVADAVDHLADLPAPLDLDRVCVVGHSAGGQLALWLTGRPLLPADAVGGDPRIVPVATAALAPVASLVAGAGLGEGAPIDWVGCPPEVDPDRWALADPVHRVGHGVPVLLVHGVGDDVVPLEQSQRYEAAARAAGDPVRLVAVDGDHMMVVDPDADAWAQTAAFLERHC